MIRYFEEIRKEDILSVGGKGANLGEMTAAGMNVPPGFVVTTEAYRLFLRENGLTDLFTRTLKEAGSHQEKLRTAAALFRTKITAGKLPSGVEGEIAAAYECLTDRCGAEPLSVAVRSSATLEDLVGASFAGQQDTYLNVTGLPAVLHQIICCYASLWSERAVSYRQTQGYSQSEAALAAVIQVMVKSETSGVLFTVNPLSHDTEEIQINASYGLGESVVSGRVTPDSFICDRRGRLVQVIIGQKRTELLYAGEGTKEVQVSQERQKARTLSDSELQALCIQAVQIEEHYGCPMDIEWAVCGGTVYILQARAITTLNKKADPLEKMQIEQYLKGCKVSKMGKKKLPFLLEKMPDAFYPFDSDMTAVIGSQISVIFSGAGIVIFLQPQMDDDGIETLPPINKKINKNIIKLGKAVRELKNYDHCHRMMEQQMQAFKKELDIFNTIQIESLELAGCGKAIQDICDYVRRLSYSRFYYALFPSYLLNITCTRAAKKINSSYTGFDFLQNLGNRTAQSARDMTDLAEQIKSRPELVKAITGGMDYASISSEFPKIVPILQGFLDKYGYSSDFNCYCIHAKSFFEDPDRLLQILHPLLTPEQTEKGMEKYTLLMKLLREQFSEKRYEKLKKNVQHLRYFHVVREESQYMWETAFYIVRHILSRAALLSTGDKDYFHNLAYLYRDEVTAMCQRGKLSDGDQEKICRRKQKRPLAVKVWEKAKLIAFTEGGDILKGVSGSTGEVIGKACIINGPKEFYKLKKGDVLVCRLTDPEWTPLFTLASAVVADTGAALSHAAIVAREYGIPAVMGVGVATTKFHDGDIIRVDGAKGEAAKVG